MASDLNRVTLIGRLTRDPELRFTANNKTPIASFSIANNRTFVTNNEKREMVSYFNCVVWGKMGEVFVKYAKKGDRVGIDGYIQQRSWEDKEGGKRSTVEVVVDSFQFLSSKSGQPTGDAAPAMNVPDGPMTQDMHNYHDESYSSSSNPMSDEDIPF